MEILVEGHGRFSPNTAIRVARELERFEVTWFEEPVPPENLRALQKVAQQTTVPIATGERFYTRWGYRELLELQACDIIMPDVIHVGGLLETKKVAAMADVYYVTVAPHNSQGPVATAASVHVCFTLPNFKILECFDDFTNPWVKQAVPGVPEVRDGVFRVPRRPGTGYPARRAGHRRPPASAGTLQFVGHRLAHAPAAQTGLARGRGETEGQPGGRNGVGFHVYMTDSDQIPLATSVARAGPR